MYVYVQLTDTVARQKLTQDCKAIIFNEILNQKNYSQQSPHSCQTVVIKKKKKVTSAKKDAEKLEPLAHCWWECKTVQLLWKTVWKFFKK